MNLIWHINRAKFEFSDPSDVDVWENNPVLNFEFSPAQSDDGGVAVFSDPESSANYFSLDSNNGKYSFSREGEHLIVSVWVRVAVDVVDDFDGDVLDEWSSENGGWASCTIDLGEDVDASIIEDDGGDWRIE